MSHFTYKNEPDMKNLCQGDVLAVTASMSEIFRQYHPYFTNKDYKYFIIITQTCDLARRDGQLCKSKYITIAAVRTLKDFLYRQASELGVTCEYGKWFLDTKYEEPRLTQLIQRLLNNNEQEYFFLSEDLAFDFSEPMVACLKVSIALKSNLHYDTCLGAKKLELSDEFKAKLGWLVGQMYSRVGTPDWQTACPDVDFDKKIEKIVQEKFIVANSANIKEIIKQIKSGDVDITDDAAIRERIMQFKPPSYYDKFVTEIEKVCTECSTFFRSDQKKDIFLRTIKSKSIFKSLVRKE